MMIKFLIFLRSIYFLLPLCAAAVSSMIWFYGPLLGWGDFYPLESETARFIAIGVLWFLTILILVLVFWLRRRRDKKMTTDIVEEAEKAAAESVDPADQLALEETKELAGRMAEAMTLLKKSKIGGGGRKYLYQLPWYIIIGPPGAGKTTAIVKSGLKFPLAEQMGMNAIGGVGGTRNCDWWFTNDAVLIDTAGRYTTQESDATVDSGAWLGFLRMLKRNRKRQPINGAVVAISLSDISTQDEGERRSHALAIRARLRELREELGVRFPVYVMFTKADLIAGFTEFFEDLGREDRAQVWGFTLPLDNGKGEGGAMSQFDAEFDALVAQLDDRSLERMQAETDHARRSLIFGFPQQVASLKRVAHEFLDDVFQSNRFEERQLLRGVYFASGTQEGTPIDRLMMSMARTFGLGRQAIGSGQGQARSYFLNRLLTQVMFREAGLVSQDDKIARRYKWILRGSIAAAVLIAAGVGAAWTISFLNNRDLIADARTDVGRYQELVSQIQVNPVKDTNIAQVVEPLNILRDLPENDLSEVEQEDVSTTYGFGLYQGGAIGTEAAQTYRGGLNQLLLPRLLLRLEQQMQTNINNPEFLYEALKVYLTLGLQAPSIDDDLVVQWMDIDWNLLFPGERNAQMRKDLNGHLTAMITQPMKEIGLNGPLVQQVRAIISSTPIAERTYQAIIQSAEARELPEWRVGEAGGPATQRVLIRISGAPFTEGVKGIYTYDGFHDVFFPAVGDVATRVQNESWILGERAPEMTEIALARLARDVLQVYYADYIRAWESVLGDIDVIPIGSMAEATEVINLLSGPNSPLVNIVKSAAEETQLTESRIDLNLSEGAEGALEIGADVVKSGLSVRTQQLLNVLGTAAPIPGQQSQEAAKPGQPVEDRFSWLHTFAFPAKEGLPSPMDELILSMNEVYNELARVGVAGFGATAGAGGGAADRLLIESERLPTGPIKRIAQQVASGAKGAAMGGMRAQINAQWQAQVAPLCRQALANRYPFAKNASADVALADFARLFAPNGMIDGFFNKHLINFVDASSKPWRWNKQATSLGISASVLTQFQHASEIRDSFFLAGAMPMVTFTITPTMLDASASSVILEVEGQQLNYAHGPIQAAAMKWPGTPGARTRIAFQPGQAGAENSIQTQGAWSFFRLLDRARVERSRSDAFNATFNIGGRSASYAVTAGSVLNPFSLPALRSFSCPSSM